jgi:Ca-activated chloride channel family protein
MRKLAALAAPLLLLTLMAAQSAMAAGYIGIRPIPAPPDWPHDWYYWHHHRHYHHHHWHYVPPPHWPPVVRELQPMTVREHRVEVSIRNQVAVTTMEQCFYNPNGRQLEGQFIFPFEDDTAISSFSMWMNGKETKGELLDAQKARGIYEDIVRRMQDPGLLEYVGRRMFKCRLFPIPANGECRIKLTYSRPLPADADLVEYSYPLAGGAPPDAASGGKMVFTLNIEDSREILNLYSPSHKLDVVRKDPRHLTASFEGQPGDRDFKLFYNISRKDVGLSFIAFRPEGEDGTFMAILTPRDTSDEKDIVAKDVIFVLDTSGSMQEDGKIEQAKKALRFCLASLREKDRFGLVTFATEAQVYAGALQEASKSAVTRAIEHVDKNVVASGGTAIDEALREAMKLNPGQDRPFMVVFLTDGEPTIGERDPATILKNVSGRTAANVRLFSFGVGTDVNAALLDDLSASNRGTCTYVVPKEDIEVKVSSFYARVSSPVLTDIKLDFGQLDAYDVCPRKLGDLFRDQQLVVVGRYRGKGGLAVKLSGKMGSREKEVVYELKAPERETGNEFLPRVWAMRKVAQLMEDVRQHGESAELRAEIVRLSKQHGIMTPYTSWLVVEDERQLVAGRGEPRPVTNVIEENFDRRRNEWRQSGGAGAAPAAPGAVFAPAKSAPASAEGRAADLALAEHARALGDEAAGGLAFGARDHFEADARKREDLLGQGGGKSSAAAQTAVMGGGGYDSLANRELARKEGLRSDGTYDLKDAKGRSLLREVGGRAFYFADDKWVDGAYRGTEKTVKVKYMSDEYFKLLQDKPELAKFLALGARVIAMCDGKFYEVTD